MGADWVPNPDAVARPPWTTDLETAIAAAILPLVRTDDERLFDSRTPLAHTHPISEVVGLQDALDAKATLAGSTFTAPITVSQGSNQTILDANKLTYTRTDGPGYVDANAAPGNAWILRTKAGDNVTMVNRIIANAGDATTVDIYGVRARSVAANDTPLIARIHPSATASNQRVIDLQDGAGSTKFYVEGDGDVTSTGKVNAGTFLQTNTGIIYMGASSAYTTLTGNATQLITEGGAGAAFNDAYR